MSYINPITWYADSNGNINTQGPDGYVRTIEGVLTAPRQYTLPDKSGTFALAGDISSLLAHVVVDMNTTADQTIELSGGSKFIITDVVITNATHALGAPQGGQIWTGLSRSGSEIADCGTTMGSLSAPSKYINWSTQQSITITQSSTIGSTVYYSNAVPVGVAATADVYIYGYVL